MSRENFNAYFWSAFWISVWLSPLVSYLWIPSAFVYSYIFFSLSGIVSFLARAYFRNNLRDMNIIWASVSLMFLAHHFNLI